MQDTLHKVMTPLEDWGDVERIEYEPDAEAGLGGGQERRFMSAQMTLGAMEEHIRTCSSFHEWRRRFPTLQRRDDELASHCDVVDKLMDAI